MQEHGLELVDVDFARGRPPWRLRVIVDNPEMDGRVPVDRCAEVSRELGARLDAAGAIETRYTLEVTTPGFDRVLAREKDFRRGARRRRAPRDAAPAWTGSGASAVACAAFEGGAAAPRGRRPRGRDPLRRGGEGELRVRVHSRRLRAGRCLAAGDGSEVGAMNLAPLKREIDQIAKDKGVDKKMIIEALEEAMRQAAKQEVRPGARDRGPLQRGDRRDRAVRVPRGRRARHRPDHADRPAPARTSTTPRPRSATRSASSSTRAASGASSPRRRSR